MTKRAKDWKKEALWLLKAKGKKLRTRVAVTFNLYFPDRRRRDLGNFEKLATDCIVEAGIIEDDCWTILAETRKRGYLDKQNPRLEIEVRKV